MVPALRYALLLAVALYFVILFNILSRRRLNLRYSLLWIISGFIMLVIGVFPEIMTFLTRLIGIKEPANGLFALVCFCLIIILMSITAIVTTLNEKCTRLVQTVALLEKRIRELEGQPVRPEEAEAFEKTGC